MKRFLAIFIGIFVVAGAAADDDCMAYKLTPRITVTSPNWSKSVVQPLAHIDLMHGHVAATLIDNYDLTADITPIEDGYCVALKNVDAVIGYNDFTVSIDIRHKPGTCTYDAILDHEDEHIRAYLSVIDDNRKNLHDAVAAAAASIMPIFVRDTADMDSAVSKMNMELSNHPDLILAHQQIRAAQEIRNRRVDQNDPGVRLKKCENN